MNLKMVDLESQYNKTKKEIDQAIQNVLDTTAFIKGPQVKKFESELQSYLCCKHVIGCANGTDALQIAMMALDLQPNDEVITANFTYVATAEVMALLHIKPVLVDVYADTMLINVEQIERAITPRTKAIVPVHLFGQCANMEAIMTIAKRHKLYVIEDTAQAIGAVYTFANGNKQRAGTIGDIGTTSFFPSKNLGCFGDGGAMMTNNDLLAQQIRMVANHGQAIQYQHDVVGVNSRLDTLQAAILAVKLNHLDSYEQARNQLATTYDKAFENHKNLIIPAREPQSTHVFHQYTLTLKGIERDPLREFLKQKGIPTMVYYPIPLNVQKAYKTEGNFPTTEHLCKNVLSLPMHTEMTPEQTNFIIEQVLEGIKHQLDSK